MVTRWHPGEAAEILALRDEFVAREFDEPAAWWPDQPYAVGGRDRRAGGTWCATDTRTGTIAMLLNRPERPTGAPSRGVLPLALLAHGDAWSDAVDLREMASFNLVRASSAGVTVWSWDGTELQREELVPGTHLVTPPGVDADHPRSRRFLPRFRDTDWLEVVTGCVPSDAPDALVVRHERGDEVWATVFGQRLSTEPDASPLVSRTPHLAGSWRRPQP